MLRPQMTETSLSLPSRLWLFWVAAFRILFDGRYAARVAALAEVGSEPEALSEPPPMAAAPPQPESSAEDGALQLLALLQREGRFVDFIQQDVTTFSDQDVGAAARLVHEGCRKALHTHARVVAVRSEAEGARVSLPQPSAEVKLVGNVAGSAPFRGVLRHRGWKATELKLPKLVGAHDPKILAQAELELS
ncbi:MAG: uncharacterized protein K0R38_2275 [Polyangiaceae bacterium]|jgi:hypothetical protein|nr:uncharacterized protein [Polyangiaceae bacterium]